MFGTMGFSELMIILVIILIIFGAGRLPQIGEGVGKALKGFKKEVNDLPPPIDPEDPNATAQASPSIGTDQQPAPSQADGNDSPSTPSNQPFVPGPEQTPGTTAALLYQGAGPKPAETPKPIAQPGAPPAQSAPGFEHAPMSMEDRQAQPVPTSRQQYPALPPGAQPKPVTKRPSAIVNKKAVARVQAQQASLKNKAAQQSNLSPQNMQSLGEGLGSAVRTFRDAAADIQNSIDPQMRTIQAELESAEKEMKESIEMVKEPLSPKEPSGTT